MNSEGINQVVLGLLVIIRGFDIIMTYDRLSLLDAVQKIVGRDRHTFWKIRIKPAPMKPAPMTGRIQGYFGSAVQPKRKRPVVKKIPPSTISIRIRRKMGQSVRTHSLEVDVPRDRSSLRQQ